MFLKLAIKEIIKDILLKEQLMKKSSLIKFAVSPDMIAKAMYNRLGKAVDLANVAKSTGMAGKFPAYYWPENYFYKKILGQFDSSTGSIGKNLSNLAERLKANLNYGNKIPTPADYKLLTDYDKILKSLPAIKEIIGKREILSPSTANLVGEQLYNLRSILGKTFNIL